MRYVLLVLGILILLAASVGVVVRSFQVGTAIEARTEVPQTGQAEPATEDRIPVAAEPKIAQQPDPRIPVAARVPALPDPAAIPAQSQPRQEAALPPSSAPGKVPFRDRLDLTAAQMERVRYVLLTHNIMQLEAADFPLQVGATVPENVNLLPLPIELSELVPDFEYYSYVISRDQIAIVATDKREIKLLIAVPAPA